MDLHLKQWRDHRHESEQQQQQPPSAKIPKLFLDLPHEPDQQHQQDPSALPLFAPEPTSKVSNLSAFSDSTTRFPKMGSYFSLTQWQELELQALIYRYMLAGAAVPPELLHPIKKSLLHSPYFLHDPLQHHYPQYYPAAWYWGRGAMDPEPGRCRRTDGKKWRCSRDVVTGHKYCERHMHRGRNRSRKPVEIPTPTTTTINTVGVAGAVGTLKTTTATSNATLASSPLGVVANGPDFGLSGPSSSVELLHFNQSSKPDNNNRSAGHILRHFFDDWPRSLEEPNNAASNASTRLSISMPGNSSSDVSLKLSTGDGEATGHQGSEREESHLNWATGWATNQMASMGGPLAEALQSSASNSSPTSVLHKLPQSSTSESSFVTT
ncbi:growth-regulating factor 3 isoform X2 [Mangifera indica]|uniref:growth-regulating factor 3 isoform X2 n=1 Tax=Mangifera indica TaxID=29780 RepID=UPI001CF9A23E|nr:growth-regulating factor 3 isoform X2 [Mangifera indica]